MTAVAQAHTAFGHLRAGGWIDATVVVGEWTTSIRVERGAD